MSDSFGLAANQLRELDWDRYAASLFIPARHRPAVQALLAFSAEVAAIRERVSEPAPGEIRLQWWVDALEGTGHGDVEQNPIAAALLQTVRQYSLPAGPLVRLLAARRFDLYHDPMTDTNQFEGYAGETVSVLHQYMAMILAGGAAEDAADAAGHLGVASALAGHLRAFAFNAARGQLFLPLSIFIAHGVREADIYTGRDSEGMGHALAQCLELAQDHAQRAGAAIKGLPGPLQPAFASLALVNQDLGLLAARRPPAFSPLPAPAPAPLRRLVALLLWTLRH